MAIISYRWEKDSRYYQATLRQDLLGDWVLVKRWGSRVNRQGQQKVVLLADYQAGLVALAQLQQQRSQRGYRIITKVSMDEA